MNFSRIARIGVALLSGVTGSVILAAQPSSTIQSSTVGYYPTYQETDIMTLSDYDYLRAQGGMLGGPDFDRLATPGGVFPNEERYGPAADVGRALRPVDYVLRPFTPGETLAIQGPTSESWFQLAGGFPFLTRNYHPERTTMVDMFGFGAAEYSPLFFDVLSISALGVYVEGSGQGFGRGGLDDGFLAALSMDFRAGMVLTDRTSLNVGGELYFIITPDLDFQVYVDAGALSALADFNMQWESGGWDFRIFDQMIPFSARHFLMDETVQNAGIQQVGHYWVGVPNFVESGSWWDSRQHYLVNTAGFTAGTFVSDSVRFLAGFGRVDTWLWKNFAEHTPTEYVSAGLFYDGYELWIAPSVLYTLTMHNFQDFAQTLTLNLTAPITPNLTAYGSFGYHWSDQFDGFDWSVGLLHRLSDRLTHSLEYASGYCDALVGDDFIGNRLTYQVGYQLGPRVSLSAFAGWYEGIAGISDQMTFGAYANIALWNYTWLRLSGAYYETESYKTADDTSANSWLYGVSISHRLAERLNAELSYEYIDSGAGRYNETAVMLRLTRTF